MSDEFRTGTLREEGEAHAKINLFLAVRGRRKDGYHELEMVNVTIDLADRVRIFDADALSVRADAPDVPDGPENLAYRAAFAFAARAGVRPRWRIEIEKRIPAGAGLGGGSADAAAVLRMLNESYGRPLSANELAETALGLGADCPYMLFGHPARVGGIGEKIRGIPMKTPLDVVVVFPGTPLATAEVYAAAPEAPAAVPPEGPREGPGPLLAALAEGDAKGVAGSLRNDLAGPAGRRLAEIPRLIGRLEALGALGASMTGSGSAVFGVFDSAEAAAAAAREVEGEVPFVWFGRTRLPSKRAGNNRA